MVDSSDTSIHLINRYLKLKYFYHYFNNLKILISFQTYNYIIVKNTILNRTYYTVLYHFFNFIIHRMLRIVLSCHGLKLISHVYTNIEIQCFEGDEQYESM